MAKLEKWAVIGNKADYKLVNSGIGNFLVDGSTLDKCAIYARSGKQLKMLIKDEDREVYLLGLVYDREGFPDGGTITTSRIREVADDLSYVITKSGSKYELGTMYHQ